MMQRRADGAVVDARSLTHTLVPSSSPSSSGGGGVVLAPGTVLTRKQLWERFVRQEEIVGIKEFFISLLRSRSSSSSDHHGDSDDGDDDEMLFRKFELGETIPPGKVTFIHIEKEIPGMDNRAKFCEMHFSNFYEHTSDDSSPSTRCLFRDGTIAMEKYKRNNKYHPRRDPRKADFVRNYGHPNGEGNTLIWHDVDGFPSVVRITDSNGIDHVTHIRMDDEKKILSLAPQRVGRSDFDHLYVYQRKSPSPKNNNTNASDDSSASATSTTSSGSSDDDNNTGFGDNKSILGGFSWARKRHGNNSNRANDCDDDDTHRVLSESLARVRITTEQQRDANKRMRRIDKIGSRERDNDDGGDHDSGLTDAFSRVRIHDVANKRSRRIQKRGALSPPPSTSSMSSSALPLALRDTRHDVQRVVRHGVRHDVRHDVQRGAVAVHNDSNPFLSQTDSENDDEDDRSRNNAVNHNALHHNNDVVDTVRSKRSRS